MIQDQIKIGQSKTYRQQISSHLWSIVSDKKLCKTLIFPVYIVTSTLKIWPQVKVITHPWVMDNNGVKYYRITGIFCSCLIFAEFCGSIQIAEIKNCKIFQSSYNDEIVSEVIVQLRKFRCLSCIV